MIKSIFSPTPNQKLFNIFLLLFRLCLGCFMLTHGVGKLDMLINEGPASFPDPLGVGNYLSLVLVVIAEFACSILLILGLATRLAAIPLIITMLVAVFIIHANDGFGKQELGLMYLVSYCLILVTGAGKFSLDFLIYSKTN